MRLKRFLLRYFPPGLLLEYERRDGSQNTACIDLLQLKAECVCARGPLARSCPAPAKNPITHHPLPPSSLPLQH